MEHEENDEKKPKYMYTKEDWDNVSFIHKFHKRVTGITLTDDLVKIYISMWLLTIVLSFFLKG